MIYITRECFRQRSQRRSRVQDAAAASQEDHLTEIIAKHCSPCQPLQFGWHKLERVNKQHAGLTTTIQADGCQGRSSGAEPCVNQCLQFVTDRPSCVSRHKTTLTKSDVLFTRVLSRNYSQRARFRARTRSSR